MQIARLLSRLPRSASRDKILSRLVATAFGAPAPANTAAADVEDRTLSVLEDSARRTVPIRMGYYTASRGDPERAHSARYVLACAVRWRCTWTD
jgi:hypothetical protein